MLRQSHYAVGNALKNYAQRNGIKFCQLEPDDSTNNFLANSPVASRMKLVLHSLLRNWMSHFDANALLNMYDLHLLSRKQFKFILHQAGAPKRFKRALDVGTGNGSIAKSLLLPMVDIVHATETSKHMVKQVQSKGIDCFSVDLADSSGSNVDEMFSKYDLMMLLNVLDRTSKPLSLLNNMTSKLERGGYMIISSPLPFRPMYYDGARTRLPLQSLMKANINSNLPDEWSKQAAWLMTEFFPSISLKVHAFSRVPYISAGDVTQRIYTYDDILIVCSKQI